MSDDHASHAGTLRTRVAAETLRDWLLHYRRGGFDALYPKPRADRGQPRRLPAEVAELLISIKPSAASDRDRMTGGGGGVESTALRALVRTLAAGIPGAWFCGFHLSAVEASQGAFQTLVCLAGGAISPTSHASAARPSCSR